MELYGAIGRVLGIHSVPPVVMFSSGPLGVGQAVSLLGVGYLVFICTSNRIIFH